MIIWLVAPALCFGESNKYVYNRNIYLSIPLSLTHFLGLQLNGIRHLFIKQNKKDKAQLSIKEGHCFHCKYEYTNLNLYTCYIV